MEHFWQFDGIILHDKYPWEKMQRENTLNILFLTISSQKPVISPKIFHTVKDNLCRTFSISFSEASLNVFYSIM